MSRSHSKRAVKLPDYWLLCPKVSCVIEDIFIAFKTPLDAKYDCDVLEESRFYPSMMLAAVSDMECQIGLVVDLTNSDKYYDKKLVQEEGCEYIKIPCKGYKETPSNGEVNRFIEECSNFLKNHPGKKIGVHCTHGHNRTGFMIISYLVSNLILTLDKAMSAFTRARHPGIYKNEYIIELYMRYGHIIDAPLPPALPSWHINSDDSPCEEAAAQVRERARGSGSDEPKSRMRKQALLSSSIPFMEGLPRAVPVSDDELIGAIKKEICEITGLSLSVFRFPGSQPVSMNKENIQLLKKGYMVSWKADGIRYMMYIRGVGEVYFLSRKNDLFKIEGLSFPSRTTSGHRSRTLLDGEMIIEEKRTGTTESPIIGHHPHFLVYDVLSLDGQNYMKEPFDVRYRTIEEQIIEPRIEAVIKGDITQKNEPIEITRKQFWDLSTLDDSDPSPKYCNNAGYLASEKFKKKLTYKQDGLVFQPVNDPYKMGSCNEILKWKRAEENTIDFKLKIVHDDRPRMSRERIGLLFVGSETKHPWGTIKLSRNMDGLEGKIVECHYESTGYLSGKWVFMRERDDRDYPNSLFTAISIYESIVDPVTIETLTDFIDREVTPVRKTKNHPPVATPPRSRK